MAAPIDMDARIAAFVAGQADDAPKQLFSEINKKNVKFIEFIEKLGKYLTDTENVPRARATRLIGSVIELLPPGFLPSEQVELVACFLQAKLADHHSVQPSALQTLAILTGHCSNLPDGLPESICTSIFREVQNQTLSQMDRRATYMILQNLLSSSMKALKNMGGDFVIGFIQQIDAEKDPRNLMMVFSCAQFISENFNLGAFTEEMFEVLSCYFPIDFTPPPNDPHGITKEELILALRKCFAATAQFAPHCVPVLLEKMTADLQSARLDAFLTLTECAPVYARSGLSSYMGSINSCVKREVLMNISAELVKSAKESAAAVYAAITPDETVNVSKDDTVVSSCVELYQDLCKYFDGNDQTKSCLAFSLCQAVASSSSVAFCALVPLVLPSLITQAKKELQPQTQVTFLKELSLFTQLLIKFISNEDVQKIATEHQASILDVFTSGLETDLSEAQSEGMKSLSSLIAEPLILIEDEQCLQFMNTLVKIVLNTKDKSIRETALSSLNQVVKVKSNLSQDIQQALKNSIKAGDNQLAQTALVSCVWDVNSFSDISQYLINLMAQLSAESTEEIIVYCQSILDLLRQHQKVEGCLNVVVDIVAIPLLRLAVTLCSQWTDQSSDKSCQVLSVLRTAIKVIAASIDKSLTESLWNVLQKFFLHNDTQSLGLIGDVKKVSPLNPTSPWQQTRLLALLEGFTEGANIQWMVEGREALFESCYTMALKCKDQFSHEAVCKTVAVMVNKATLGSQIQWFLEPIIDGTKAVMSGSDGKAAQFRALTFWTWLTKAMECRAHSATALFSTHLVSLLSDPVLGPEVPKSLGMVLEDQPDVLSLQLRASITPLYKQRFFAINFKALMHGYEDSTDKDIKQNYLTAISIIASHLPVQVLKPHLSKIVPLLLLCLNKLDDQTSGQTLATLTCALTASPELIIPNVDTLVKHLLRIAKTDSAMKTRIAALSCLDKVTALPSHVVVPLQKVVVRQLASVLDDKKRLVRKQAVETRAAWILLETSSD